MLQRMRECAVSVTFYSLGRTLRAVKLHYGSQFIEVPPPRYHVRAVPAARRTQGIPDG
jgi:hypothetical protein